MSPSDGAVDPVLNPSDLEDKVGQIQWATEAQARMAAQTAQPWAAAPEERARILNAAADLYEAHYGELFALLHREAGKSLPDAVAELREAVDFLRYYASQATGDAPRGTFACISPWNFPLAIFTGQIAAALAAGNAVLAKPAEQTPLIAFRATQLLHEAGVPQEALHLLPGAGDIGAALTSAPQVAGVAFTGGTETAQIIHRSMAAHLDPGAPLIAETGGLNAMIVDSTALPEQAVQAIVESAFQSAGQRCSALRCLYVQEDVADTLLTMLKGAMDALTLGNPWHPATDVGPVIDQEALDTITNHVEQARAEGRLLHALETPKDGLFAAPALIRIKGIEDLNREIFGPVLHVATFKARDLKKVIKTINATGYGLTFGLHTRIDDRVEMVTNAIEAGNIYVNRNQIGAIVGSQPFGGEGLSGTGPKAGGPHYLARFRAQPAPECDPEPLPPIDPEHAQLALQHAARQQAQPLRQTLPGPTGEANVLSTRPRPPVLCLGPGRDAVEQQAQAVRALGGHPCPLHGALDPQALAALDGFSAAIWWGDQEMAQAARMALATRPGPITTLITGMPDAAHVLMERHTCIDTTAAGGNAALLAGQP
jgi:RHH-type proline utilization regulon transcriptional repressor/proline dehydrogenase/delta 1-pyrroline-5-carboxylate dehydrogenase